MSEGLNLQEASVVVHLDLPWNPARLEQRVGRVRRLGSRHEVVTVYSFSPPASGERLLRIERRLREKLRAAQRSIGVAGHILPTLAHPAARAIAERSGEIRRILREWMGDAPGGVRADRPGIPCAAVESLHGGFVAAIRGVDETTLVVEMAGAISDDEESILRGIECAHGPCVEPDPELVEQAVGRLDQYLATRIGDATIDFTAAAAGRARRTALRRVALAVARTPRHRRATIAPLADAARAVALAPFGAGAERVLDMLVAADLPDEAWLRSLAAFADLHVRARPTPSIGSTPELVALLLLRRLAL